jgi:hypothetical protein
MMRLFSLAVTLAALAGSVSASIDPIRLPIVNRVIKPDGFNRS